MENKKKRGFFDILIGKKEKGCCCDFELEEVPEEKTERKNENEQLIGNKKAEISSNKLPEENADKMNEKDNNVLFERDFMAGKKELPKIGYGPG